MEKHCKRCNQVKEINDFHIRNASPDRRDMYCKECRKLDNKRPKNLKECGRDEDREGAERVLEALGYELYNDDNPVYVQFEKRLATKYKNR